MDPNAPIPARPVATAFEPAGAPQAACARHEGRPATSACERCGRYACPECSVTQEGVTWCTTCVAKVGRPVVSRPPPWELPERDALGAFFATAVQAATDPDRTFTARPARPARSPFAFAALLLALASFAPLALAALVAALFEPMVALVLVGVAGPLLFLGQLAVLAIWGLMSHGIARAFGGGQAGFGASARAVCYAASPLGLGVIPVLGHMYGALVAVSILAVGLQRSHESGSSSAAAAALGGAVATLLFAGVLGALAAVLLAAF